MPINISKDISAKRKYRARDERKRRDDGREARGFIMIARLPLPWSRSQSRRRSSSERDKIRYAKALNDRSRCTLLYFNSDKCKLCAYLSKKHLHELFEEDNEGELNLVQLSIENESWYPEVLYYRIGKCFAASVFSLSIFNPLTDLSLTLSSFSSQNTCLASSCWIRRTGLDSRARFLLTQREF